MSVKSSLKQRQLFVKFKPQEKKKLEYNKKNAIRKGCVFCGAWRRLEGDFCASKNPKGKRSDVQFDTNRICETGVRMVPFVQSNSRKS